MFRRSVCNESSQEKNLLHVDSNLKGQFAICFEPDILSRPSTSNESDNNGNSTNGGQVKFC